MHSRTVPSTAGQRRPLHADDPIAKALARRILSRLGIPPLLSVMLLVIALPDRIEAREGFPSTVRASAEARVVVLADAARLRGGRLTRSDAGGRRAREVDYPLPGRERACDGRLASDRACRMIVIDLQ